MIDVTHKDIDDRLQRGEGRFSVIEGKLDCLIDSVQSLTSAVDPIRDDISTIKEMATGWKAATALGRFMKWIGGFATAFAAVWILLKAGAKALIP